MRRLIKFNGIKSKNICSVAIISHGVINLRPFARRRQSHGHRIVSHSSNSLLRKSLLSSRSSLQLITPISADVRRTLGVFVSLPRDLSNLAIAR